MKKFLKLVAAGYMGILVAAIVSAFLSENWSAVLAWAVAFWWFREYMKELEKADTKVQAVAIAVVKHVAPMRAFMNLHKNALPPGLGNRHWAEEIERVVQDIDREQLKLKGGGNVEKMDA
jgi:hypothetical protein